MSDILIELKNGQKLVHKNASMFTENGGILIRGKTDPKNTYYEDLAFYSASSVENAFNNSAFPDYITTNDLKDEIRSQDGEQNLTKMSRQ